MAALKELSGGTVFWCALMLLLLFGDAAPTGNTKTTTLFVHTTSGAVWGTPLIQSKTVFVNSYDRSITALDRDTGKVSWTKLASNSDRANMVLHAKGLVDVTLSGTVTMRSTATGATIWEHQRKSMTWVFSPVAFQDFIFVPSRNDDIVVLSASTGEEIASVPSSSGVWGTPLLLDSGDNSPVLVTCKTADAMVRAFAFHSNGSKSNPLKYDKVLWNFDAVPTATHYKQRQHAWVFGGPVACQWNRTQTAVIFGSNDRVVRAVDSKTGVLLWAVKVQGKISSTPVVAYCSVDGAATPFPVISTENGDLICFGSTGKIRWQTSIRQSVPSIVSASILNNIVVLGGSRGIVVGVDGADGKVVFQFEVSGCSIRSSCGLSRDGADLIVVCGCADGKVTATRVHNIPQSQVLPSHVDKGVALPASKFLPAIVEGIESASKEPQLPSRSPLIIAAVLAVVGCICVFAKQQQSHKTKN